MPTISISNTASTSPAWRQARFSRGSEKKYPDFMFPKKDFGLLSLPNPLTVLDALLIEGIRDRRKFSNIVDLNLAALAA